MANSRKECSPLFQDNIQNDYTFDCKSTLEHLSYFSKKLKCATDNNHKFKEACEELNNLHGDVLIHCNQLGK